MTKPAIRFDHVSKVYRLGQSRRSLREALARLGRVLHSGEPEQDRAFWALRDVSFEVSEGEALGVIGPNGAGKTTTLKLLSKITQPTTGRIEVNGRVSALIELGAGFHPDLTGRENVYLNGAILGLTCSEIDRKFDNIVAFSGLEPFIDTPVKRYSSGMYVRLGFAVAAHVEPQVLLVDEVLSVGDAEFRQKCAQRIEELRRLGTTIVFISHNLYLVQSICEEVIFLADGQIHAVGDPVSTIEAYESWVRVAHLSHTISSPDKERADPGSVSPVVITDIAIRNASNGDGALRPSEAAEIQISYYANEVIINPRIYLKILRSDGIVCCMVRSSDYRNQLQDLHGEGTVDLVLDPLQLTPGVYMLDAEILGTLEGVALTEKFSPPFEVAGSTVGREGFFVPRVRAVDVECRRSNGGDEGISNSKQ